MEDRYYAETAKKKRNMPRVTFKRTSEHTVCVCLCIALLQFEPRVYFVLYTCVCALSLCCHSVSHHIIFFFVFYAFILLIIIDVMIERKIILYTVYTNTFWALVFFHYWFGPWRARLCVCVCMYMKNICVWDPLNMVFTLTVEHAVVWCVWRMLDEHWAHIRKFCTLTMHSKK